jgi:hypothetical protein
VHPHESIEDALPAFFRGIALRRQERSPAHGGKHDHRVLPRFEQLLEEREHARRDIAGEEARFEIGDEQIALVRRGLRPGQQRAPGGRAIDGLADVQNGELVLLRQVFDGMLLTGDEQMRAAARLQLRVSLWQPRRVGDVEQKDALAEETDG